MVDAIYAMGTYHDGLSEGEKNIFIVYFNI